MKFEPKSELPTRMRSLPLDERGYPVPWFVAWVNEKPEFRAADHAKFVLAIKEKRCFVCGDILGIYKTFVVGPMCGINRNTAEPACHIDCAVWSAINCPFLSNENMRRNESGLDELGASNPGGVMIKRNPGVTLLWTTKEFRLVRADNGYLIRIGEPSQVQFYKSGRPANRFEIEEAVSKGLPLLRSVADEHNEGSALDSAIDQFWHVVEQHNVAH